MMAVERDGKRLAKIEKGLQELQMRTGNLEAMWGVHDMKMN